MSAGMRSGAVARPRAAVVLAVAIALGFADPGAAAATMTRQELTQNYGVRPVPSVPLHRTQALDRSPPERDRSGANGAGAPAFAASRASGWSTARTRRPFVTVALNPPRHGHHGAGVPTRRPGVPSARPRARLRATRSWPSAAGAHAVHGRSIGYTKPPGTTAWVPNTDTLPYRGTSDGGGYSTVEDVARFADALLSHKLLSPDSTKLLITGKVRDGPGTRYAYGFEDARDADRNGWVGHGGGAPGMNGDLRIYPKSGYVVAVLANLDPPAAQGISEYLDARLPTER